MTISIRHDENGKPLESELAKVARCVHGLMPSLGYLEDEHLYKLDCAKGCMMLGGDEAQVAEFWNRAESWMIQDTYRRIGDLGHGRADQSFCINCQRPTATKQIGHGAAYKAECTVCKMDKRRGDL